MKKRLICLAFGVCLVLCSCSGRPALTKAQEVPYNETEALIKVAKKDLETAKKAGADKYAKSLTANSESSIKTAETLLRNKDFDRAKEAAQKGGNDAKLALNLPTDAVNSVTEAENQLNSAKEGAADVEAPESFKEATDSLAAAKAAITKKDYNAAKDSARASVEAAKKSIEEPAAAKASIAQAENDLNMAKSLGLDQSAADQFKAASDGLESAKATLETHDNAKVKELADKASTDVKEEMKKSINLVVEQAKTDLDNAKTAGAAEFAAEQLALAEESVTNATALLESGDYASAKTSAEKASASSKDGEAKAKIGKEAKALTEGTTPTEGTTSTTEGVEGSPVTTEGSPATTEGSPATTEDSPATTEGSPATTETASTDSGSTTTPTETSSTDTKKSDTKPTEDKATSIDTKKEDGSVPLTASTASTKTGGSKFPVVPIVIVAVIAIVAIVVIRIIRRKVTANA